MVFAGIYPVEGEDYANLKDALEKLQLNDASLVFEPETSQALNFGFRCGFLGMFHMEIIQERLEREYNLDIIVTSPSVEYEVVLQTGETILIDSPADLPDEMLIEQIREPWMNIEIFSPTEFYGMIMELTKKKRGVFVSQDYPAPNRVQLNFQIPLSELIVDFFDLLKSRTRGYASLDYQFAEYRPDDLVKLEILVNEEPVDALATIVHRNDAYHKGQAVITKLKEVIPRQLFLVPIQAYAAGRVISRANIKAHAQGCACQVLWRRYLAQEEAVGKAKTWQETHEDGWECGNSPGGFSGGFAHWGGVRSLFLQPRIIGSASYPA